MGNYGEAGAINLYGPAYGLPAAISGINSYWLRGYGVPPPETLVLVGMPGVGARQLFSQCEVAGRVRDRCDVPNEETTVSPIIYVCRGLRQPWLEFWAQHRHFG